MKIQAVSVSFTAVTPSALRRSTVTPSTQKLSVRVYIALRGSESHDAYNRLLFCFLGVGPDHVSNGNHRQFLLFYCLIVFIMYYSFNKTLEIGL